MSIGPGWRLVGAFERAGRGSALARIWAFVLFVGFIWILYARHSDLERVRFPIVALAAVIAFEVVVALARRDDARSEPAVDDMKQQRQAPIAVGVRVGVAS